MSCFLVPPGDVVDRPVTARGFFFGRYGPSWAFLGSILGGSGVHFLSFWCSFSLQFASYLNLTSSSDPNLVQLASITDFAMKIYG